MKATEITKRYHGQLERPRRRCACCPVHKGGMLCKPDTYPGIGGEDLANFVKGVWASVPDLSIEPLNTGEIEPGLVAHHWIIRGTDIGPRADGSQATGRSFSIKGASIIQVEGDKIRSDQCCFDRKALDKQLEPK